MFPAPAAEMMDYRFKPLSKTCAGTGLPLVPGSVCHSVLIEKHGTMERLDFSPDGWRGLPAEAVGCWQCVVPPAETRQAATADPEMLFQYFEQLVEDPNPHQARLCYVLALYLLQRRRLKLDGSCRRDDREHLQLSGSRGEGPYEILDQQLSESEISQLRAALDQSLTQHGQAA